MRDKLKEKMAGVTTPECHVHIEESQLNVHATVLAVGAFVFPTPLLSDLYLIRKYVAVWKQLPISNF